MSVSGVGISCEWELEVTDRIGLKGFDPRDQAAIIRLRICRDRFVIPLGCSHLAPEERYGGYRSNRVVCSVARGMSLSGSRSQSQLQSELYEEWDSLNASKDIFEYERRIATLLSPVQCIRERVSSGWCLKLTGATQPQSPACTRLLGVLDTVKAEEAARQYEASSGGGLAGLSP